MAENWLQTYLVEAVRRPLCTKVDCTTCGAEEFRAGLVAALNAATDRNFPTNLSQDSAAALLRALREVTPAGETAASPEFEKAVRYIVVEVWDHSPLAKDDIEALLIHSWAGSVLARMQEHHRAIGGYDEFNNPANIEMRREAKKRLKQEQYEQRMVRKKERDNIWRALLAYAAMVNTLDVKKLEPLLADDFHYASQWVFAEIESKEAYLDYMAAKFQAVMSVSSKLWAEMATINRDSWGPCVVLAQGGKDDLIAVILVKVHNDKIKRIDMCCVPPPRWAKRSGEYPK
jgi:hypothetical protein